MSGAPLVLEILIVDDDPQVIAQLKKLLPETLGGHPIRWVYSGNFDEALEILRLRRFDLLVSDIYLGRDTPHKTVAEGTIKARDLVSEIREHRFCPIVLFSDGQIPDDLTEKPFVWVADKGGSGNELEKKIIEAISTGLPAIARRLHDDLDKFTGSYVWQFLAERWKTFGPAAGLAPETLERVIKRRASVQLGRMVSGEHGVAKRDSIDSVDVYIYPPIGEPRLGEILRNKKDGHFCVILTPHCYLRKQAGQEKPRAEFVLVTKTLPYDEMAKLWNWENEKDIDGALRRRTSMPSSHMKSLPEGRYFFLPGFLELPPLYCDLMQVESVKDEELFSAYERIAVLDAPFAEALQASFAKLNGSVGVPPLDIEGLRHLLPPPKA